MGDHYYKQNEYDHMYTYTFNIMTIKQKYEKYD